MTEEGESGLTPKVLWEAIPDPIASYASRPRRLSTPVALLRTGHAIPVHTPINATCKLGSPG